jgi:hypothetical protein
MIETAKNSQAYGKVPDPESDLEFPGNDVSFQQIVISGTSYIARISQSNLGNRAPRCIVITRDDVGIIEIEFDPEHCPPRQILGRWYKTIQPAAQPFKLHVHSQVEAITLIYFNC